MRATAEVKGHLLYIVYIVAHRFLFVELLAIFPAILPNPINVVAPARAFDVINYYRLVSQAQRGFSLVNRTGME